MIDKDDVMLVADILALHSDEGVNAMRNIYEHCLPNPQWSFDEIYLSKDLMLEMARRKAKSVEIRNQMPS